MSQQRLIWFAKKKCRQNHFGKPGMTYGSAGNGSPHLGAEMLRMQAGIDIRHVPYRGSKPAMLDVIAGNISLMVVDLQPALQLIRKNKMTALGVTTPERVAVAPDIPTLAESGLPGFELVAPAHTPRPVIARLAAEIGKLVGDEAVRGQIAAAALEPMPPSTPESFTAYVKSEGDRWAGIVKAAGIEPE